MAITSWIRRQFKDAVSTSDTLPGGCTAGATTLTLADGSSFPDGSVGPFIVTIDQNLATEEKVLIASRTGPTLSVALNGRGYNGTVAHVHGTSASVLHTIDAQDLDEANQAVVQTLGAIAAKGDLLVGASPNNLNKVAIGSTSQTLQVVGGTVSWVSYGSGGTAAIASAGADGVSTNYARYDHTHQGVASFNARLGTVTPTTGDYTVAQVTGAAPIASPTFTGTTTAPEFSASGLTGATAASRYVGATASGAPSSGTFATGDYIVDQTGSLWVCTAAGTPGTWQKSYPALSTAAGHLGSLYTLTTGFVTFLSTASLAVGTWLVTMNTSVFTGVAGQGVEIRVVAGTATATFEGNTSVQSVATGSGAALTVGAPLAFIATVTVAGTLAFQGIAGGTSGTPTIGATTSSGQSNATGYTATRVA
jgi:hypothetical protein